MSDYRRVFNPGPGEVVFNAAGGILGAGEWSEPCDLSDPGTSRHLARGHLIAEPVAEPAPEPPTKKAPARRGQGNTTNGEK